MSTIRRISMIDGVSGRNWFDVPKEYIEQSTQEELDTAIKDFEKWWEDNVTKVFPIDVAEKGHYTVYCLMQAYEQAAREDGIRTGVRIVHEAFADAPVIRTLP